MSSETGSQAWQDHSIKSLEKNLKVSGKTGAVQMELMGRYMTELGLTPVARTRLPEVHTEASDQVTKIEMVIVSVDEKGNRVETPMPESSGRVHDMRLSN